MAAFAMSTSMPRPEPSNEPDLPPLLTSRLAYVYVKTSARSYNAGVLRSLVGGHRNVARDSERHAAARLVCVIGARLMFAQSRIGSENRCFVKSS
jgi:hypothetical protein